MSISIETALHDVGNARRQVISRRQVDWGYEPYMTVYEQNRRLTGDVFDLRSKLVELLRINAFQAEQLARVQEQCRDYCNQLTYKLYCYKSQLQAEREERTRLEQHWRDFVSSVVYFRVHMLLVIHTNALMTITKTNGSRNLE